MRKTKRQNQGRSERGVGLILVLLLILVSVAATGSLVALINSTTRQSLSARTREAAYGATEASINKTIFEIEAGMGDPANLLDVETYLTNQLGQAHTGTRIYTGTADGNNYTVTLSDPVAGDQMFQLDAAADFRGTTRNITVIVRGEPVEALNYALFGNYIHFDNHNQVNYGVTLETSVFSNSGILIDKGIRIQGPTQAVQFIMPNTGPGSGGAVPDTILSPAGEQGDPDPAPVVATAPVIQVVPPPEVKAFPPFDFPTVEAQATADGRNLTPVEFTTLLANARIFALTLAGAQLNAPVPLPAADYPLGVLPGNVPMSVIHHSSADPALHRKVRSPNVDTPDLSMDVGSPDGVGPGPNDTYEIIFEGNEAPDDDSVIYVNSLLDITLPMDTLMRLEGSLVVNGKFSLHAASEILSWENRQAPWFVPLGNTLYDFAVNAAEAGDPNKDIRYSRYPAIAANGAIKIDKSGAGNGGPTHIEGVVYSVAESHLHRSEMRERAYSVGSEIADVVHNCQFFSFSYDPEARNTLGFYIRLSGRPHLEVVRIEDRL